MRRILLIASAPDKQLTDKYPAATVYIKMGLLLESETDILDPVGVVIVTDETGSLLEIAEKYEIIMAVGVGKSRGIS